jgi:hypothetical protein
MTDYVGRCRAEWRRLAVPDALAEEMAADLASDLSEAEADGISAEELWGSDARSFAASLAAERGIIPAPLSPAKTRRRPLVLVAFTVIAALVLIFAARALLTGQPKATLVANVSGTPGHHLPSATPFPFAPPGGAQRVFDLGNLAAPIEWILLVFAIVALGFALWLWSSWARSRPPSMPV